MKIYLRIVISFILIFNLNLTNCNSIPVTDHKCATWIWYPGDFEIYWHNIISIQRTQKGIHIPQIIRMDNFYPSVQFAKEVDLKSNDTITIACDGMYNVQIDNNLIYDTNSTLVIPNGKHKIIISVCNIKSLPALFVKGNQINSDETWKVSCYDRNWYNVGHWNFEDINSSPNIFRLPTIERQPLKVERKNNSIFVDFGKETFGYLKLKKQSGKGKLQINYGESVEEAESDSCETIDRFFFKKEESELFLNSDSRAFRYVNLKFDRYVSIDSISMLYEYLPIEKRGEFRSSDEKLNKIWDVSSYTLELTAREFFIDGIKRDRWIWSGDATQCYLMNYYLFFNKEINKRTMLALRGKEPVSTHLNTILDYSFYWFIGIYDYYLYTGDIQFIELIYPKMVSLINFCLERRNSLGFVEGMKDDWVFVDWANIDKTGELSIEQILFLRSLQIMSYFSQMLDDDDNHFRFNEIESDLKKKIEATFWNPGKGIYMHNRKNGKVTDEVTKYPNIFAVLFNFHGNDVNNRILKNAILNDSIIKITTPYMKFYELAAMAECNQFSKVLAEISNYWGGMLDLGATTFWESFNPEEKGLQHFSNGHPDRPFARSLCHAWGASPVYILGKYFLGVKPLSPGFKEFEINPHLAYLNYMEGVVPVNNGSVNLYIDKLKIEVNTNVDGGILKIRSHSLPKSNFGKFARVGGNEYSINILKNVNYAITYKCSE